MDAGQLEGLIRDLGFTYVRVVSRADDTNIMFCCPFHGERHPSCGISAEKEVGNCFACGQTFTIPYLIAYVRGISIRKAKDFLEEKFNVSKKTLNKTKLSIRRFDDAPVKPQRAVLSRLKLAPYRSGKVAHNYILSRGITKDTCREFMLGWDEEKKRITIPVFWEDNQLAGFLGRAVLEPKIDGEDNPMYKAVYANSDKYLVYNFERSHILFPINRFVPTPDKEVIIVEGSLDAIWLYQLGFRNTLALLTSKMSREQAEMMKSLGILRVNLFLDNDKAGKNGKAQLFSLLKRDFVCYDVQYPEGKKDPQNLSHDEIMFMLKNRTRYGVLELKRIV
jgi:DNA primase